MIRLRKIMKRMDAVWNIRTITRTLEMIAAGRLARWRKQRQQLASTVGPMEHMLASAMAATDPAEHPLLNAVAEGRSGVLVLAGDRGLCGGYNHHVLSEACRVVAPLDPGQVRTYVFGRRGAAMARIGFTARVEGRPVRLPGPHRAWAWFRQAEIVSRVADLVDELMEEFALGWIGSLQVVHMALGAGGAVLPKVTRLLPVAAAEGTAPVGHQFVPDPDTVLEALLPMAVRIRAMQCFIEAGLAEQTARLHAMSSATQNAGDMILRLNRQINHARQGRITAEMCELAAGVEASE